MSASEEEKYYAGDTLSKTFTITDNADSEFDPTTLTVKVYDKNDVLIVTKQIADLVRTALGVYNFTTKLPSDAVDGIWVIQVSASLTAGDLANTEEFKFKVVKKKGSV